MSMSDNRPKPAQGTPPWVLKGNVSVERRRAVPEAGTPPWVLRVTLELGDNVPGTLKRILSDGMQSQKLPEVLAIVSQAVNAPASAPAHAPAIPVVPAAEAAPAKPLPKQEPEAA